MIIDNFARPGLTALNGSTWRLVTDQVMGGLSTGDASYGLFPGRGAMRLQGAVSLENNGGFIQAALDLAPDGGGIDASSFIGIELDVKGNGETYSLHLRTLDSTRPWQSYRQSFTAGSEWARIRLPFAGFAAHRIEMPLDCRRLRRIGLVAIGRAFSVDLCVSHVAFYRA